MPVRRFLGVDDWRRQALCRGANASLWYSTRVADIRSAQEVCARCPVSAPCLRDALATESTLEGVFGIRAGTLPDERKRLIRRRKRLAKIA
jgi:hypothetical protein